MGTNKSISGENIFRPIAYFHSDFKDKFGIPRQSGLVDSLEGTVVFTDEFRDPDALRGLEGFSHIWLLWKFSLSEREKWSPTVRPPRLGGNTRMGVFATRSPYRPNPIGLSSVRLLGIERDARLGQILRVSGADILDMTPIYDIKPYIPLTDCHADASSGFAGQFSDYSLKVNFPSDLLAAVPENKRQALIGVLAQDPRPSYQNDPERIYGMSFASLEVKFSVDGDELTVRSVESK